MFLMFTITLNGNVAGLILNGGTCIIIKNTFGRLNASSCKQLSDLLNDLVVNDDTGRRTLALKRKDAEKKGR